MNRFWAKLILVAGLLLPQMATAERELHVVGVYEGNLRTDGQIHGPQVAVIVDRPGQHVVLFLQSHNAVRWFVETTYGTTIETIVKAGHRSAESEVYLNDIPFEATIIQDWRSTHRAEGERFQHLRAVAPDLFGVPQVSSFLGSYTAPELPFLIDGANGVRETLKPEYLPMSVADRSAVPEDIWHFVATRQHDTLPKVQLRRDGVTIITEDGETDFDVTLDVPPFSWPKGAVYDPETGFVYVVTVGGEGFLYSLDSRNGDWSVIRSQGGYDAHGVVLDREGGRFLMAGGLFEPGEFQILGRDGAVEAFKIDKSEFPGLTDLYDVGNGPAPLFTPVYFDDGWLVVDATTEHARASQEHNRLYAVHLETKEVHLLAFEG